MKYLIIFCLILAISKFAYSSECDSRGRESVKECLTKMYQSLNKTIELLNEANDPNFNLADEYFCKAYAKKSLCLGDNEEKCFDVESYTKAFGINAGVKLLRYDALWHFTCNANYKLTEEDKKCEADSNVEELCKEGDQSCDAIKNRLDCIKKTFTEKCGNEKLTEFRVGAYKYTVNKILPNCNVQESPRRCRCFSCHHFN